MVTSSRRETGTAGERTNMFSEVGPDDSQVYEKDSSTAHIDLQSEYRLLEQRLRNMRMWLYTLAFLLVFCFTLLLFSLGSSRKTSTNGQNALSPVPEMPKKSVMFDRSDLFANHSNSKSNDAWAGLMPVGDGFVVVQNSDKFGLQAGKPSDQGPMYDISVFHQLHCLNHIRHYLYTAMDLARDGLQSEAAVRFINQPDEHVFHCFDYIRQALMCNADMTVEWPREEKDGSRFAVDGWGINHQCKDWDSVMKWMEDNRFKQPWEHTP